MNKEEQLQLLNTIHSSKYKEFPPIQNYVHTHYKVYINDDNNGAKAVAICQNEFGQTYDLNFSYDIDFSTIETSIADLFCEYGGINKYFDLPIQNEQI